MSAGARTGRKWALLLGGAAVVAVVAVLVVIYALRAPPPAPAEERRWVEVKRVHRGDAAEVHPDDAVVYAGIRAPYKDEPGKEEAKRRNEELVVGKKMRLRFDENERDKKGRLVAYAFVDGKMINEILVREGLAFARITTGTQRYAKELLAAQAEARRKKRGIWEHISASVEPEYKADPKYGAFHRPSCGELPKIDPQRIVVVRNKDEAFDRGFAPCAKCAP